MMKLLKSKKLIAILSCISIVLAMSFCFATGGTTTNNQEAFVTGLTQAISPDNMWGSLVPMISLISGLFIFAFVYGRIRKVSKKGSNGKFGI